MQCYKLSEIVDIVTGYTFRSALRADDKGNYKVIQAKDVSGNLFLTDNNLIKIKADKLPKNTMVKTGDVILSSRGKYRASVVDINFPTIASSSVFVLRPKTTIINSEYLSIFLNSVLGQSQLEKLTSGSYIKSVPKSNLIGLVVKTPPLSEQIKISQLCKNIIKQQKILEKNTSILSMVAENSLLHVLNSYN